MKKIVSTKIKNNISMLQKNMNMLCKESIPKLIRTTFFKMQGLKLKYNNNNLNL